MSDGEPCGCGGVAGDEPVPVPPPISVELPVPLPVPVCGVVFSEELGEAPEAYERLLNDALRGDTTLFMREDALEETWRIVQPLLDVPPPLETYANGSWGPASADRVVAGFSGWHEPWLGGTGITPSG